MSHGIGNRDKIVGIKPFWHGLNEVVEKITKENNPLCLWDATAAPMVIEGPSEKKKQGAVVRTIPGKPIQTGYHILTATDDKLPIGVPFTGSYTPLFNADFVKLVEDSLASVPDLQFVIESAGSIKDKNRVFMSVFLPGSSEFQVDGRQFLSYLNFLNSFDMSCRLTVLDSNICTVCNNTFTANLAEDNGAVKISVKHTKNMADTIKDIPLIIQAAITGREKFAQKLKFFSEFPVKLEQAEQIFAAYLGLDDKGNPVELSTRTANMVDKLKELFARGKGNKGETALDVFQAVTEYYTHFSSGESEDKFKQFESSEFGYGAKNKSMFFKALCGATESTDKFNGVARIGEKILIAYRSVTPEQRKAERAARKAAKGK